MRALLAIARKEAWESRWKTLVISLILVATALSLPFVFEWLPRGIGDLPLSHHLWERIQARMADSRYYLWASWYGKNQLQTLAVAALIFGMGIIARERESGSLGYTLSRPVTRRGLLLVKLAVAAASLALMSFLGTLVLLVTWGLTTPGPIPWDILMGLPQSTLGVWVLLALTALFSTLSRDQVMALVGSGTVLVLMLVAGLIPRVRPYSLVHQMAATHTLETGQLDLFVMALLLALLTLLVLASVRVMERTDL